MLDTNSRSLIANRIMADRQAEARRARLISEARRQRPDYEVRTGRPTSAPSLLGRLAQAVRGVGRASVGTHSTGHHPAMLG